MHHHGLTASPCQKLLSRFRRYSPFELHRKRFAVSIPLVMSGVLLSGCISSVSEVKPVQTTQDPQIQSQDPVPVAQLPLNEQLVTDEQGQTLPIPVLNPQRFTNPVAVASAQQNTTEVTAVDSKVAKNSEQPTEEPEVVQNQQAKLQKNVVEQPGSNQLALLENEEKTRSAQISSQVAQSNPSQPVLRPASDLTHADQTAVQPNSLPAQEAKPKRKSFLARLFARSKPKQASTDDRNSPILQNPSTKRRVSLFSRSRPSTNRLGGLPGVKRDRALFKMGKEEDRKENILLAAVGGFGRLSPKDLRLQTDKVNVSCIKPEVIRIVKIVERHYGKKPIITSGYRSPSRNRRAGGARNSMHIYCKAVDMQVEGVSKWTLAKFLRSVPGRGGVGTYCRTKSVHVDTGPKRDWHHPCRRKSKRLRRSKRRKT